MCTLSVSSSCELLSDSQIYTGFSIRRAISERRNLFAFSEYSVLFVVLLGQMERFAFGGE